MSIRCKIKNIFFTILTVFIISVYLYSSSNISFETRGTWLWASSINSEKKAKENIKKILKANLNTVFLLVPKTVKNHGKGKEANFEFFIKQAYRNGLSVHAWFLCGRRQGRKHRSKKYINIDFNDKNEQKKQIEWVSYFLNKYSKYLDGIHLDYIRLKKSMPVSLLKMKGITKTISGIRKIIKKKDQNKFLTVASFTVGAGFKRPYNTHFTWNQDVPLWYKGWIKDTPASHYKKIKHGQIRIGTPFFMHKQQDPITWIKKDLIDATIIMQYTTLDKKWQNEITQFRSFLKYSGLNDKHLYMGLGWMPNRHERDTRGYDAPGIVRKIKEGRKKQYTRICDIYLIK